MGGIIIKDSLLSTYETSPEQMKIKLNLSFRKKKKSCMKKTYPLEIQNIYEVNNDFKNDNPLRTRKIKNKKKNPNFNLFFDVDDVFECKNPLFSEIIKNTVETEKKSNVKIMFVLTIFIIYIIWTLSTQ